VNRRQKLNESGRRVDRLKAVQQQDRMDAAASMGLHIDAMDGQHLARFCHRRHAVSSVVRGF
jgi:hypothetical protein